jgi:N-acetylglucosamine-6-phosphate deacetylase
VGPDGETMSLTIPADGSVAEPSDPVDDVVDGTGWTIEPGFVDLQVNGGFGHHFTTDPERIWDVGAGLVAHGVTAFLPTLISPSIGEARAADAVLAAGPPEGWVGAKPLGLHLEGPALNPVFRGAHPGDRLAEPTTARVGEWLALEHLQLVTLAPELPGAFSAIERLAEAGVVASIGHTAATAQEVRAAADAGATMVTHLFNAMRPFHHRDPGPIVAALTDNRLTVGLIADGVHVAPEALDLAWRAAGPDRVMLTTDAVTGLGIEDSEAARLNDGTLAGGTTPFHEVRRTFREAVAGDRARPMGSPTNATSATSVAAPRGTAVQTETSIPRVTSTNARRVIDEATAPGTDRADVVVLDGGGLPRATVVSGRLTTMPPRNSR